MRSLEDIISANRAAVSCGVPNAPRLGAGAITTKWMVVVQKDGTVIDLLPAYEAFEKYDHAVRTGQVVLLDHGHDA